MRPIIHSQKHYVQTTLSTATVGTRVNTKYIEAVAVADKSTGLEVEEGASVKAIFIEMWVIGTSADQFFTAICEKIPAGAAFPSFTQMSDLNSYTNKKNILWTSQGLTGNDGISNPTVILKQWIKIPKGKQRFGLGDKFLFSIASRGDATITFCGFATYKEYT